MDSIKEIDKNVDNQGSKGKFNWKKTGNIVANVVLYIFLFFCLFAVIVSVVLRKNSDGAATIFGYQLRIVVSDSMAKCDETYDSIKQYKIKDIPIKSLVLIKTMPKNEEEAEKWYANLKEGDVLTFKYTYTKQETITHRITKVTKKADGSGYFIFLKGDNRASENSDALEQVIDTSIPNNTNYVIGKVVDVNYFVGSIITFIKKPVGIILLVIVPCLIIIVLEVIRLVTYFSNERKQKYETETQKNKDEIEELKRKLELLEKEKQQQSLNNSQKNSNGISEKEILDTNKENKIETNDKDVSEDEKSEETKQANQTNTLVQSASGESVAKTTRAKSNKTGSNVNKKGGQGNKTKTTKKTQSATKTNENKQKNSSNSTKKDDK